VPEGRRPDYNVCFYKRLPDGERVERDRRRRGWFRQVGVGWKERNGRITIQLDSRPFDWDGKLTLFDVTQNFDDGDED